MLEFSPRLTGSVVIDGDLTVSGGNSGSYSGSFQGDGSQLTGIVSSSFATTASYAVSASHEITLEASSSFSNTSISASFADSSISASFAQLSTSASFADISISSSFAQRSVSSSFAFTASYAENAGGGSGFPFTGSAEISGSLVVTDGISGSGTGIVDVKGIQELTVTVDTSAGNQYAIDGVIRPKLTFTPAQIYRFDLSDVSNNGHPLAFRLPNDSSYTDGVTTVGTAGNAGAYVDIEIGYNTSGSLKYYCTVHGNGMGNSISVFDAFDVELSGSFTGSVSIDNDSDDRVVTAKGDGGFNAESGLTYDGSTLSVTGAITSTGDITGNTSDDRLKDRVDEVDNALEKVDDLTAFYYRYNELANSFGLYDDNQRVGLSAQELQDVLPEAVAPAPFDIDENGESKSGENYLTVRYERVVPLLVAAIKELKEQNIGLAKKIENILIKLQRE